MDIKLPIVSRGITMAEIPGRITYYIEIGNCVRDCQGCHSPYLSEPIDPVNFTDLTELLEDCKKDMNRGADAVLIMGGTTNGIPLETLEKVIRAFSRLLPVGIYSGDAVLSPSTSFLMKLNCLTWIKAGEYNEELGGLSSPTTNQRFYKAIPLLHFESNGFYAGSTVEWIDKTEEFQL